MCGEKGEGESSKCTQHIEWCRIGHLEKKFSNQAQFRECPGGLKVIPFVEIGSFWFFFFIDVRRVTTTALIYTQKKILYLGLHFAEIQSEVIRCYHRLINFFCCLPFSEHKGNHQSIIKILLHYIIIILNLIIIQTFIIRKLLKVRHDRREGLS